MATKVGEIIIKIEEEEGVVVTSSVTFEYDNEEDLEGKCRIDYTSSASGGPVMRPRKPRF